MADYIDREKVMEEIHRIGGHNLCEWDTIGVKALIDRQPTADVVPRSEVEELREELEKEQVWANSMIDNLRDDIRKLQKAKQEVAKQIFEEIHKEIEFALDSNYKARHEHLNKYPNIDNDFVSMVGGKISALRGIDDFIDELKKKYIGE